jgi:CRP-like cAMP-binding protein
MSDMSSQLSIQIAMMQAASKIIYETYKRGEYVFKTGDVGTRVYFLCFGFAEIIGETPGETEDDKPTEVVIARKKQFEHFGEYAIVAENGLRRASVASASSLLELFYLQAADYKQFAGASDAQNLSTQRAYLPTVPCFSQMSHDEISELAFRCNVRNFKAGSLIYKQGEEPKHL